MNAMDWFGVSSGCISPRPSSSNSMASDIKTVEQFVRDPSLLSPQVVAGAVERLAGRELVSAEQWQLFDYVLNDLRVERGLADCGAESKLPETQVSDYMGCSHADLFYLQSQILPKLSGKYQQLRAKCLVRTAQIFDLELPATV